MYVTLRVLCGAEYVQHDYLRSLGSRHLAFGRRIACEMEHIITSHDNVKKCPLSRQPAKLSQIGYFFSCESVTLGNALFVTYVCKSVRMFVT